MFSIFWFLEEKMLINFVEFQDSLVSKFFVDIIPPCKNWIIGQNFYPDKNSKNFSPLSKKWTYQFLAEFAFS